MRGAGGLAALIVAAFEDVYSDCDVLLGMDSLVGTVFVALADNGVVPDCDSILDKFFVLASVLLSSICKNCPGYAHNLEGMDAREGPSGVCTQAQMVCS